MFEVRNVSRKFGDEYALKNVSMKIGQGLNFIIGASGSGKTTLLKLLSGMDQAFEGEVFYNNKSVKSLTPSEKSLYYGHSFGFIWQDFNLIEELSVFDNIKLPLYLKDKSSDEIVEKVMKQMKIFNLADKKVKNLSGGQKQRVAIARELVKNPEVIIADEPTAALDSKSASITMDILKQLSRSKTVIVVTHDASLIEEGSTIFELDKGELIDTVQRGKINEKFSSKSIIKQNAFSLGKALSIAKSNVKSSIGRYLALLLTIFISANLLLVSIGGGIQSDSEKSFEELYNDYGDTILDISLVSSFMSAAGTDDSEKDKPNANVDQDLSGFYDKYVNDRRVSYVAFIQPFNNITIFIDGKSFNVQGSGNSPILNKLVAGNMPSENGNEVVVPESFVKNMGLENHDVIGREIDFNAEIYNWDSGEPVPKKVNVKAKISGVADTTASYEYMGEINKFTVDDAFFFSKDAVIKIREQAEEDKDSMNLILRAKTPEDVISIKDELNAQGIVPLGYFELIEDMVRLQSQTKEQSGSAVVIISVLVVFVALAIAAITAAMRKKEIAIYKVSGYGSKEISRVTIAEYIIIGIFTVAVFIVASPLTNKVLKGVFSTEILNVTSLGLGGIVIFIITLICAGITIFINTLVKEEKCLKSGDR